VVTDLVERLAVARIGSTYNQYEDSELRRERLRRYLEERAQTSILLVGEAPGYRGTRISGIPLTSERQLSGSGPAEATATIVHRVLAELGVAADVLLWNVVPTHPHRLGLPESNRAPTREEIDQSASFLRELASGRRVIPLGRIAQEAVGGTYVRHPAQGGAAAFRAGLATALQ